MDEHNGKSKNADSLEFLLVPVKKEKNLHKDFLLLEKKQNLSKIERNFHKKIKQRKQQPDAPAKQSDFETSISAKLTVNNHYHNSSITIQSSISNQENSIKQQQERILYRGRKKIHNQIKTIDSTHSCDIKYMTKYEYFFNKRKQIKHLLDMDKSVRKEKEKYARSKINDNVDRCGSKCTYSKKVQEFDDIEGSKSRVRIFGQLGLTQDDQYILNCAATLNDKPIQTNFMYMDNNKSLYRRDYNDVEAMATQATQVNFNFSKDKPLKALKNKSVQCYCNITQCTNMETHVSKTELEDVELKQCKSPLVVISVYPRQDSVDIVNKSNSVKIIRHQVSPQNKMLCNVNKGTNVHTSGGKQSKIDHIFNTSEPKSIKRRSPSPTTQAVLKEKNKTTDIKLTRINNTLRKQSPLRQKSPDKSVHNFNDVKPNMNNPDSKYIRKPGLGKPQSNISATNKEQVKKALVMSFFNNAGKINNNFARNKLFGPTKDASKITIDINGEKEDYNVLLEQRKFDTGLSVRKTVKDQSRKRNREKNVENSRKKILVQPDSVRGEEGKGYGKTTRYTRLSGFAPKLLATESKINVKDSLEVCHRREERNSTRIEPKQIERKAINVRNKHYRGDNCSISDPNERDQEIRKLLGVLREQRYQEEKTETNHPENTNGDYCSRIRGSKDLTIIHNVPKFLSNRGLKNKSKKDKYQGAEAVQAKTYNTLSLEDNVLEKQIIVKKDNRFTVNSVSYKTQNLLSSYIKKENHILNPNVLVILQIEKKTKPIILTKKQYEKVKRIIKCTSSNPSLEKRKRFHINDIDCNVVSVGNIQMKRKRQQQYFNRETQTESTLKCVEIQYESQSQNKKVYKESVKKFNKNFLNVTEKVKAKSDPRKILSSIEFRYASVEYSKHVSSGHFKDEKINSFQHNNMHEDTKFIQTIFKGQRKCVTPNLGTSVFSLNSDSTNGSNYSIKPLPCFGDGKVKKPFLKRLLSCLLMRSQTSDLKHTDNQRKVPSRNSSLDSYNISTSLGALKMSSSLYDTSASFYSNHSIIPINKTRKGVLNSMRGFLTIRRI